MRRDVLTTNRRVATVVPTTVSKGVPLVILRPIHNDEARLSAALYTAKDGFNKFELAARQEVWLQIVDREGIDLTRQVVAETDGKLVGACLYQINPGQAGVVFTPVFSEATWRADLAVRLVCAARDAAFAGGVHLCQSLLQPEATEEMDAFRQAGFRKLARLMHMEREVSAAPILTGTLRYESYTQQNAKRLHDVIARSYEGTQDCVDLNNRRGITDVIASHQAAGIYDPAYWLLASCENEDVGCLLLNRCRFRPAWEIVYVAVVPEHRGYGYGRHLVAHALTTSSDNGATSVILTMDDHNEPALRIYRDLGFQTYLRTVAMVCFSDDHR